MKLPHRRQFLQLTACTLAVPAVSRIARAQPYPSRPVRIIVGFAAGGAAVIGDIAPVASINRMPFVMEVNPSFPAKTVAEFIANAKANPGKISYGCGGVGSISHLSAELLKMMAGIDILHVPYRGGALAVTDLIGAQVQVVFDPIASSIEYIRAGRLRPSAVTTRERSVALSDVPTVADFVPGYETSAWFGIGVAKGTPTEVIERLNKAINEALADPKMKARLANLGGSALAGSPADFGKLIADETEKWGEVVKFAKSSRSREVRNVKPG